MKPDNMKDFYEERAAIIEYEAKKDRQQAQKEAYRLLQEKIMQNQNAKMGFN